MKKIGVIGSGFSGCIIANELAKTGKYIIDIYEARHHIGGNCYTEKDPETGVMVHAYGPHIFNTSKKDIWDYVNTLTSFKPYINRVKAVTDKGIFPLPINLRTINLFFGENFTPAEAETFIDSLADKTIADPQSFEEQALRFVGKALYENFFKGYTLKQWGIHPQHLPASILKRLPVRFTDDDNYYNSTYQGIPTSGYTPIFQKLLDHPHITLHLNKKFTRQTHGAAHDYIFYSGPIDAYFDYKIGKLQYRTLRFERHTQEGSFQGSAVVNYCQQEIPYTRISEHKFFTPWEHHTQTVYFKEYSSLAQDNDTPYYPIRLLDDKALLEAYEKLAVEEKKVSFMGRLGTYRYLDMDVVIAESLDIASKCATLPMEQWPTFPQSTSK
ncbi:MAG: UDP-galactopyranose mutase [Deltaproteobacteria bacterium]|nr:UDP-galactopyranose mutase [Deltaproteobacteria bacterium]